MILGTGIDRCLIERVRRSIDRFGDDWIDVVFTEAEKRRCNDSTNRAVHFALALCCKEAAFKAFGTGLIDGMSWHDIEVLKTGPDTTLYIAGFTLQHLNSITPEKHEPIFHISLADDRHTAKAVVIVSANASIDACDVQVG